MSFLLKLKEKFRDENKPANAQAYLERAASRQDEGNYLGALDDYEMAIRLLPPGADRIAAHANRARLHRNMKNWDGALADLEYILGEAPTAGFAYADRALVRLMREESEAALSDLDRAIALLPDGLDKAIAYSNRGSARETGGDLPGALADYEQAIAVEPQFTPAYEHRDRIRKLLTDVEPTAPVPAALTVAATGLYQRANQAAKQGNLIDALAAYTRILELYPRAASMFYERGVTFNKLDLYQQAVNDLDKAISLRPRFPAALTERGLTLTEMGKTEDALADIGKALSLDPGYAIAHQNKGYAEARAGRWQEALASADMGCRLEPDNLTYRAGRGEIYVHLGQYDKARRDLQACLDNAPDGPKSGAIHDLLSRIPGTTAHEPESAPPWPPETLWPEYVVLHLDTKTEEMIQQVQTSQIFYVVLLLNDEQWAVVSVYGPAGLRDRLTTVGDIIGRAILPMRLGQLPDLWRPCVPVSLESSLETAWEACSKSGGRTLALKRGEIIGVMECRPTHHYPSLPTAIFGPTYAFDHEEDENLHHRCAYCQATFAYYTPIQKEGLLADFACPICGFSPIPAWIEARMRPGRWSVGGFLAEDEVLQEVVAADEVTLRRLTVTHEQIAAALDRLLAAAIRVHQEEFVEARDAFNAHLVATKTYALEGLAKPTMRYDLQEAMAELRQGRLPPENAGARMGDFQVLLQPYLGYQHCPFTIQCRPWSDDVPSIPIKAQSLNGSTVLSLEMQLALPCRAGQTYRYSDVDFLVVNRNTGAFCAGPGLIVHLIRDDYFFEGPASPYRVEPEAIAQVLGLLQSG